MNLYKLGITKLVTKLLNKESCQPIRNIPEFFWSCLQSKWGQHTVYSESVGSQTICEKEADGNVTGECLIREYKWFLGPSVVRVVRVVWVWVHCVVWSRGHGSVPVRRPSQHGSLKIDLSQRVTECGEWRGERRQETGDRRKERVMAVVMAHTRLPYPLVVRCWWGCDSWPCQSPLDCYQATRTLWSDLEQVTTDLLSTFVEILNSYGQIFVCVNLS